MAAGRSRVVCTPHEGEPAMPIPPDDLESAVLVVRDLSGHLPGRTQIYRLVWALNGRTGLAPAVIARCHRRTASGSPETGVVETVTSG